MTLTVGSLFSGIGGLELGLERAGMKTLWQVECDEYARKVLEKQWPSVTRYTDVREVHGDAGDCTDGFDCGHRLVPVDLICGGFPCQDISVAGKGAGLDGERSGLWSQFRRLIRELRPRFVLVENVSALLVRGLDRVLGDLAASGYDAEWDCIPAAAVGAPHRRDRLFIVAYAQREHVREQSEPISRRCGEDESRDHGATRDVADTEGVRRREGWSGRPVCNGQLRSTESAETVANADRTRFFKQQRAESALKEFAATQCAGWWGLEPDVGRVAHGVRARVDRLRCLGNAVVPQVAEFIGRRIVEVA